MCSNKHYKTHHSFLNKCVTHSVCCETLPVKSSSWLNGCASWITGILFQWWMPPRPPLPIDSHHRTLPKKEIMQCLVYNYSRVMVLCSDSPPAPRNNREIMKWTCWVTSDTWTCQRQNPRASYWLLPLCRSSLTSPVGNVASSSPMPLAESSEE